MRQGESPEGTVAVPDLGLISSKSSLILSALCGDYLVQSCGQRGPFHPKDLQVSVACQKGTALNKLFLFLTIGLVGCDVTVGGHAPLKWAENAMLETVSMETSIRVTWPPVQEGRVSAYQLYLGDEVAAVVDGGQLTYQLDGLDPAREYSIAVRAANPEGHFSATALRARVWTIDETPLAGKCGQHRDPELNRCNSIGRVLRITTRSRTISCIRAAL